MSIQLMTSKVSYFIVTCVHKICIRCADCIHLIHLYLFLQYPHKTQIPKEDWRFMICLARMLSEGKNYPTLSLYVGILDYTHNLLFSYYIHSYRDLMREYSFNAIMASWLSYEDNRSLQHNIEKSGFISYPDENYAREIMQLFSIGLHKLNMDGSIIYQENGNPEDSYSIDDIVSYSRAWTGFVERPERGGAATGKSAFVLFYLVSSVSYEV